MTKPLVRNDTAAGSQHRLDSQAPSKDRVPSPTTRPKLKRTSSYLFYSKHNHVDAADAVGHHSILLPSDIEDRIIGDANSSVLTHVWHTASTASALCLLASIGATFSHENPALMLYIVGWAATLLWVRTTLGDQQHPNGSFLLAWALVFSIFTAMQLLLFYHSNSISLSHLSIPAVFLFFFARNVHMSYTQFQHDTRQRIQAQMKAAQTFVNQSTATITTNRLRLLEAITQEIKSASSIITTTLEHFTPSSVLAHPDELLSACTIAVPITSISAIHTAVKQVNHINNNIGLVTSLLASESESSNGLEPASGSLTKFDVGELVQNVGDALAGMAANLDVHLVIHHMDNSLHYSNIAGNEGAVRHILMDLICRIMEEGCTPGATIEVGLGIASLPSEDACLKRVTFDIVHTCSPAIPFTLSSVLTPTSRLTAQLMQYIGENMTVEQIERDRTRFRLTIDVQAVSCEDEDRQSFVIDTSARHILSNQFRGFELASRLTRKDLETFVESHLKCLKMVLHAPEQSVFATHLTRYLTNLNADISHIPITSSLTRHAETDHQQSPIHPSTPTGEPLLVLVDDDIPTLERLFLGLRAPHLPPSAPQPLSDKPTQQKHHRRHGSKGSHSSLGNSTCVLAIICFGSLNKYKQIRKIVQSFASQHAFAMPRVLVIPKPAGPLRFLTALHTAWYNPVVEPHYFPIATSPLSPMTAHPVEPFTSNPTTPSETRNYWNYSPATGNEPSFHTRRQQQQQQQQQQRRISPSTSSARTEQHYFSLHEVASTAPPMNVNSQLHDDPIRLRSLSGTFLARDVETQLDAMATPFRGPQAAFGGYGDNATDHRTGHIDQRQEKTSAVGGPLPDTGAGTSSEIKDMEGTQSSTSVSGAPSSLASAGAAAVVVETPPITNTLVPNKPSRRFIARNKKKRDRRIPFSGAISPPINVLIVEDNKINQVILQTWMKKHNIKHSSATNGQEAVEKWKGGGFHLVLMDIQLPIMDGIEATKSIRALEKKQHIGVLPAADGAMGMTDIAPAASDPGSESPPITPFRSPVIIVALTASSHESDRHAALAAGCNDFLTKPVSLEWLEKKIVEWGCMQALIDFDGWRRWRQSTSSSVSPPSLSSSNPNQGSRQPRPRAQRLSKQNEPTEEPPKEQVRPNLISNSRRAISMQEGILLAGVGSKSGGPPKRTASMDDAPLQRGGNGGRGGGLSLANWNAPSFEGVGEEPLV